MTADISHCLYIYQEVALQESLPKAGCVHGPMGPFISCQKCWWSRPTVRMSLKCPTGDQKSLCQDDKWPAHTPFTLELHSNVSSIYLSETGIFFTSSSASGVGERKEWMEHRLRKKPACVLSVQCAIVVEICKLWMHQNLFVCTYAKQKEGNWLFGSENCPCRALIMQNHVLTTGFFRQKAVVQC